MDLKNEDNVTMPVLVVDLDGTLLRSDMLFETFWAAFSRDWRSLFRAFFALTQGRAALKSYLARIATINPTTLPYDPKVIAYIEAWRNKKGRVALVTASDHTMANLIAKHLGLFDEVYGSDEHNNLKGEVKAQFLCNHFSGAGFAYMGDTLADLPVWKTSQRAITLNVSSTLKHQVDSLNVVSEHLTSVERTLVPYIQALRLHQWLKNVLIFLPMLVAHQITTITFLQSIVAFVAFSLIASHVYLLNDLLDLSVDRAHPRKRNRPFAAGSVPITQGTWMALGLLFFGAVITFTLDWLFAGVMLGYYLVTTAYSLFIKRRMVLDICVLAGLYTTRIVAGGVATAIPLSEWLLIFSIFIFFALAAVKRQAELVDNAQREKPYIQGRGYQCNDVSLISQMAISAGYVAVLIMALYISSPAVTALYTLPSALWGICVVLLYWISRIVMITQRGGMHDDPLVFTAKDRVSQLCFLIIVALVCAGAWL